MQLKRSLLIFATRCIPPRPRRARRQLPQACSIRETQNHATFDGALVHAMLSSRSVWTVAATFVCSAKLSDSCRSKRLPTSDPARLPGQQMT